MKVVSLLIVISIFAFGESVLAQVVYKCKDSSGATVFSQTPCAQDAEVKFVQDSTSGISSYKPVESAVSRYAAEKRAKREEARAKLALDKENQRSQGSDIAAQRVYEDARKSGASTKSAAAAAAAIRATAGDSNALKIYEQARKSGTSHKSAAEAAAAYATIGDNREAQRVYEEARKSRTSHKSAAEAAAAYATIGDNREAQRVYEEARKSGASHKYAAEAAAIYGNGIPAPSEANKGSEINESIQYDESKMRINNPATPILSTKGGFYNPTSPEGEQYMAPDGSFCRKEGAFMNCAGTLKHAEGLVVEPPKN